MGLINIASSNSCWRGLDYYKEKKVSNYKKISDNEYEATINGSNGEKYNIFMDIDHPKKSKCNCPHAKDKKIICKHIVALYFTDFPKEATKFVDDMKKAEAEYRQYEEDIYNKAVNKIAKMSKKELEEIVIHLLNYSPDWVYEHFIREYVGW